MAHNVYIDSLLDALESRGYRGVLENPAAITITAPNGERADLPIEPWFRFIDAHAEHGLPTAATRYADQAVSLFANVDSTDSNLRIRIYTDEYMNQVATLGDLRVRRGDALLTRRLAPGLMETVVIDTPDSIRTLNRQEVKGRDPNAVFGAAIRNSLAEDHFRVFEHSYGPVTVLALEAGHRYIGAHAHMLSRYVNPATARLGALVSFPTPEVVVVYEIGPVLSIATTTALVYWIAKQYMTQSEHQLLLRLYWWRPGAYEELGDRGPLSGGGPDLRELRFDVDFRADTIRAQTAETGELLELWRNAL
ncbi:hypothetical protein [Nocardia sp. NPDC005978]|uniref:hypothetical protein n=1 Tax=unclassified Nocardia TaxID=2637762 RepID=UPI0033B71669